MFDGGAERGVEVEQQEEDAGDAVGDQGLQILIVGIVIVVEIAPVAVGAVFLADGVEAVAGAGAEGQVLDRGLPGGLPDDQAYVAVLSVRAVLLQCVFRLCEAVFRRDVGGHQDHEKACNQADDEQHGFPVCPAFVDRVEAQRQVDEDEGDDAGAGVEAEDTDQQNRIDDVEGDFLQRGGRVVVVDEIDKDEDVCESGVEGHVGGMPQEGEGGVVEVGVVAGVGELVEAVAE